MIYPVYSMRDKHTGFSVPTFDVNDQSAIRNFSNALVNAGGILSFAPADFDLYRLGEFDSDTGRLTPEQLPVMIISGSSALPRPEVSHD